MMAAVMVLVLFAAPVMANAPDADVNGSSSVDVVDVQLTVNFILAVATPTGTQGDANYDGAVDVVDVQTIVNVILGNPIPLGLSTRPLASGTLATPYSAQLLAFGATPPYTFSTWGALPGGLSLSSAGLLSGTPSASGTFSLPVTVTATGGVPTFFTHSLTVFTASTGTPAFVSSPVTSVTFPNTYTYNIVVTGSPTPTLTIFNKPAWLTLTGTTLSGTPQEQHFGTTGQITLSASNGNLPNATQSFTVAVNSGGPTPAFTSTAVTSVNQGVQYVYNIVATGTPPATVSASGLPTWLSLSGRTLSGIPQAQHVGTAGPITLTASNGNLPNATQVFSITVNPPGSAPNFTTAVPTTTATSFVAYSYAVIATGSPTPTVTATNLPRWLTFTSGTLSGTPGAGDVGQTGLITLTASNGVGNPAVQNFRITVAGQQYPGFQPEILYEYPATVEAGTGLLPNFGRMIIVFSKEMNPAVMTVGTTNAIFVGHGPLAGAYTTNSNTTSTFATGLDGLTNRILVVTPGTTFGASPHVLLNLWPERVSSGTPGQGCYDTNGNALVSYYPDRRFGSFSGDPSVGIVWANTLSTDTTPPTRASSIPAASATNAAATTDIRVTFNEIINPATISGNFTVTDGIGAVPGSLTVDITNMTTVIFTPSRSLLTTVNVSVAGIRDIGNNAALSSQNFSFTIGTDAVAPTLTNVTVDGIPDHLNGSAANGGNSPGGGRLQVPQDGFTIDMSYTDAGGSGVSRTIADFSITANVTVGTVASGQNLATGFPATHVHVTDTSASFLVPSTMTFPVGAVTLTVRVRDIVGNQSAAVTYTIGVIAATTAITPLEGSPDVWNLYFNRDHETTVFNFPGNDITSTNNDLVSPNSIADFTEDLTAHGFMGGAGSTNLVSSGGGLQMQQAARNWIINRILYHCHRTYGLHVPYTDGNNNPGFAAIMNSANPSSTIESVNVRFVNSDAVPSTSVPRMAFGGIPGTIVLGRAGFNVNNTNRAEDNGVTTAQTNLGCFTLNDMFSAWNGTPPSSTSNMFTYYDEITPFAGATVGNPIGTDANDPFILDPQQNPATFTGTRATRYRKVVRAMDAFALQWAVVASHEIGHSLGLIADGAPGTGLYGGVAVFTGSTAGHVSLAPYQTGIGQNIMNPSISFEASQSRFTLFNELALAYLIGRELVN